VPEGTGGAHLGGADGQAGVAVDHADGERALDRARRARRPGGRRRGRVPAPAAAGRRERRDREDEKADRTR
jgi:hypothetical protein